jgi:hypothetical protein
MDHKAAVMPAGSANPSINFAPAAFAETNSVCAATGGTETGRL